MQPPLLHEEPGGATAPPHPRVFSGTAKGSGGSDAGVQSIGSAVVDVTPGDDFELIARQTFASIKNVTADELTWFAIEVVE